MSGQSGIVLKLHVHRNWLGTITSYTTIIKGFLDTLSVHQSCCLVVPTVIKSTKFSLGF